jgi:ankyrin repeat protein
MSLIDQRLLPDDLLQHVFHPYLEDDDYKNLMQISNWSQLETVIFLGIDCNAFNNFALRYASENGNLEIVNYLVNHGANVNAVNGYAFRSACRNGHLEVAKCLLAHGANIYHLHVLGVVNHLQKHPNIYKGLIGSALQLACYCGQLDIIKFLLKLGFNHPSDWGDGLNIATHSGHFECAKYLISLGTDVHYNQNSIFETAVSNDRFEITQLLFASATQPIPVKTLQKLCKIACRNGLEAHIIFYILQGIDLETSGGELLKLASEYGHLEVIKLLIYNGVHNYSEAFKIACIKNQLQIVKFFYDEKIISRDEIFTYFNNNGRNLKIWSDIQIIIGSQC